MNRYANGIIFAVLWTVGMTAWTWPVGTVQLVILTICGAMAGAAFHLMSEWWAERQSQRGP
jgi:hypothetical protein